MRSTIAFVVLLAVTPASAVRAQDPVQLGDNAVYLELLGNGGAYSLSYERLVSPMVAVRAGVSAWVTGSLWGDEESSFLTVPLTVSILPGGGRSGWEFGGGLVLGRKNVTAPAYGCDCNDPSESTGIVDLTGILGYRWVGKSGLMFRLGFTPFLALSGDYPDEGFLPSGGLSFGVTF